MGKRNTSCCWYKFSEFKSLESSDSEQHNEGNQETRRNQGTKARKKAKKKGDMCQSSSVRPVDFLRS